MEDPKPESKREEMPGYVLAIRSVSARTWVLVLALVLISTVLAVLAVRFETLRRIALAVENDNVQLIDQVDRAHGEIIGAMLVQGLIDPRIKQVLSGEHPPDEVLYDAFAAVIRHFEVDNMQLVGRDGIVVAYVDKDGSHHSVGSDRNVRPFVARTLEGFTSRDPVIGRTSGRRGIYLAAPVHAEASQDSAILGSVVVRTGLEAVDRVLQEHADPVLLLSPEGLIYASNRAEWQLKLVEPLVAEEIDALRESQQFGRLVSSGLPDVVSIRLERNFALVEGERYSISIQALDWADSAEPWRLVLLRERGFLVEWGPALVVAAAICLFSATALLIWLRRESWRLQAEQVRAARDAEVLAVTEASHARLLQMSESLPCAIFQYLVPKDAGIEPRFLFVAEPVHEILGLTPFQLLTDWRCHLRQIDRMDRWLFARALIRARRERTPFTVDFRIGLANRLRWIRMSARQLADPRGTLWTGYWLDVSDEVAHREDLLARERQLGHLLESAPGAVMVASDEGTVLFYNQHAKELFALPAANVFDLYVDPAERLALLEALKREDRVTRDEVLMRRTDGDTLWARVSLSRGTFGGQPNVVFGWAEDITERRQAAETMRRAKEAAEASAAARSAFLANMSHEIRTPMNAIIGLAHLALQTALTVKQRDYIEKVHRAAKGLLGIINDILDFSKFDAGKLVLERADFDLRDTLDSVIALTREMASSKGLQFEFELDDDVPQWLSGDALRLNQVLTNLISNAVKFTDNGMVKVHCSAQRSNRTEVMLVFVVTDTGIGMSADQTTRIFEPFSQADETTTRRFGGTGLGLSISKRLVEAAGGTLALESRLGEGSCFRFTWPCALAADQRSDPGPVESKILPVLSGLRVLLVEDNQINQLVAVELMQSVGVEVDVADNGQKALEKLHAKPDGYDLVLMDLQMPVMDGHEATRRIRADGRWSMLPVIAMTAHVMVEERQRCLEEGMNDHVGKPIEPNDLYRTLAVWGGRPEAAMVRAEGGTRPGVSMGSSETGASWLSRLAVALPALDLDAALRRVRGDQALYASLLARYVADQHDIVERFEAAMRSNEGAVAMRLAHGFKGMSATLGLTALADLAAPLERFEPGSCAWRENLSALQKALEPVLATLKIHLPSPSAPASCPAQTDRHASLQRLMDLLGAMDAEACECLDELAPWLSTELGEAEWRALQRSMRDFDFDRALAVLQRNSLTGAVSGMAAN